MIKKIYGKHTFYFSVLTICLSIISLLIAGNFKLSNELITPLLCLFFILSIGISHGAMDNYKANKLLKIYKLNNKLIFFVIYILISFSVILLSKSAIFGLTPSLSISSSTVTTEVNFCTLSTSLSYVLTILLAI